MLNDSNFVGLQENWEAVYQQRHLDYPATTNLIEAKKTSAIGKSKIPLISFVKCLV